MAVAPRPSKPFVAMALFALAALAPALLMRGFTVDDALIPARYAAHLASGAGYRFNAGGAVTDGVTPLGFAYILAPFCGGDPFQALFAAKLIGVVAWVLGAALLGRAVGALSSKPIRFASLLLVLFSAPLAAWSAAGLETGLVAGLVTAGVSLRALEKRWDRIGSCAVGLGAALRPELLPMAAVLALTPSPFGKGGAGARLALAGAPFVVVALIRVAVFGGPMPLSALAKPPDAEIGANYALACFLLTGPVALLAPFVFRRLSPFAKGLVAAVVLHFVAIALAGGDWMPLSRLAVPALGVSALAAAYVLVEGAAWAGMARLGVAVAGEVFAWSRAGTEAMRVSDDRRAVMAALGPALRGGHVIATVDIGWVGAVAMDATVVDLAGVTDPPIAALPGGHTTKRIPMTLLDSRGVDTLVLLLGDGARVASPWTASRFSRGVEQWMALQPGIEGQFTPVAESAGAPLHYVVLRRIAPETAFVGDRACGASALR